MDPATISAGITGVVGLLSAYMQYRVGMKQAEQKGEAAPQKPEQQTLEKGEQALVVVQKAVAEHGNEDDQADLANFERNPGRYKDDIIRVIQDIAKRDQAFADQILKLQPQVGNKANQGTVNNTNSTTQGINAGVIDNSDIKQTFNK
ncbi:MAG: hypothetical protein GFH27_549291n70 [Chloroflexi bacterium AL-W]|nr:hypothetical protein [Chloroflexi bacterium AL-N1]NOK67463.1 hypothetical protein [Chloroflexi bacterium AL-N10]NOK75045.1 hypothetical protein [Chloroflexi bacterium AL-N5]NOK81832.1 hypothetical protein [Chloroflexi bacterium AL-W]NOK89678.1 hypothetical protein [Chloroflexi bacterium AL-N15]